MKIPIEALELVRFASTNEGRTTLEWLRLENGASKEMRATATDGTMLAQLTWMPNDESDLAMPVHLSADDVRAHLKRVPKKARQEGGDVKAGSVVPHPGGMHTLQLHELAPQHVMSDPNPNFPDTSQIIPPRELSEFNDKKPQGVTFGMNLYLIQRVHDWAKATNNQTRMTFTGSDPLSPFRMDLDLPEIGGAVVFVVMPCRI